MAKKLNSTIGVNLAFTADTDRAKRQLQDLQNQLSKIISQPMQLQINDANMTQKLREASLAAADLKVHLEKATNVDTGTLDFSKLSQSIKQSGTSLNEYANKIKEIGPAGQQAFLSLAQSVASAEIPIRRSNKLVTEMWTSLKNTARWQISSSVLHGFTGALQSAYGYAEDLNESLNNIRIVTGQSIEQMADFAKEANKAAKALSTTTTEYTKASLIYYQQGLSDKEVKDRTDITIKMANAAGQNAETVSDQLTAVWNNFYDGSKSLEYYADVMTALGAATASSTEEISTGLNKFAAIAETVGLSYEYAASALATVTATTRQSADIVGTAFKTLFARIQDLELGKTLDDGTTLGKYSAALDTIGVNIKDDNNNLKEMDQILEEMAAKWNTISKDEQTALAQTVAGTRQYTQLVALMENWDFMQQNLGTSYGATGTLNEQAEIYAESWEAARDRVQASLETVYEKLLDDEFFIKLLNGLEKTITGVDKLIDSMGGLKGVLSVVGVMATKIFEKQLSQSLQNLSYNMKMMTESGRRSVQKEREGIISQAIDSLEATGENDYQVDEQTRNSMKRQLELQQALTENASKMNEAELARNKLLLERNKILEDQAMKLAQQEDEANAVVDDLLGGLSVKYQKSGGSMEDYKDLIGGVKVNLTAKNALARYNNKDDFDTFIQGALGSRVGDAEVQKVLADGALSNNEKLSSLKGLFQLRAEGLLDSHFGKILNNDDIAKITVALENQVDVQVKRNKAEEEAIGIYEKSKDVITNYKGHVISTTDRIVASANAAMSVVSAWTMLKNAWETIEDPDTSGWEKLLTVMTTMSMTIPSLASGLSSLKTVFAGSGVADMVGAAGEKIGEKIPAKLKINNNKAIFSKEDNEELEKLIKDYNITKNKDGSINFIADGKESRTTAFEQYKKGNLNRPDQLLTTDGKQIKGGEGSTSEALMRYKKLEADKFAASKGTLLKSAASWGILAGVILASVVAIQALDKAYNKNAIAAQKAAKAAEELNKQYAEATDRYNELKSTISEYDSARKAIDDLTFGTTEYTDAVNEANDASLKLLDTYADVIGNNYTIGSNGLITINEEALDTIKRQEQDSMLLARAAAQAGEQSSREAQLTADITELNRKKIKSKEGWDNDDTNRTALGGAIGAGGTAAAMAAYGAVVGSAVPVVGTLVGAAVGLAAGAITAGVISGVTKNSETEEETKAINALIKAYEKDNTILTDRRSIDLALQEQGIDVTGDLLDQLIANKESIDELCKENKKNTLATEAETRALVAQLNADNEKIAASRDAEAISVFAGKHYQKVQDDALANMADVNYVNGIGIAKDEVSWGRTIEEIAADYIKANLGDLDNVKITDYKEGKIKYTYTDEAGEKQSKSIDRAVWQNWEAARIATEENQVISEKIAQITAKLSKENVDILASTAKKDMSALSLGALQRAADNGGEILLTNEQRKTLGFGSQGEMSSQISSQAEQALKDIQQYANSQIDGVGIITSKLIANADGAIKNLSQITLKNYADTLDTLIYSGGQSLGENFTSSLTGIMNQYSSQADEIMSIANAIDWTDYDAITQFNYQLMEIGINIDENSNQWKTFVQSIQEVNLSVIHKDFETLRSQLAEIQEITKDISLGSLVSDDDYKKILQLKPELAELFMMTANGYKYIGSESLNVEDALLEQLRQNKENNFKANNLYTKISEAMDPSEDEAFDWQAYALGNKTMNSADFKNFLALLEEKDFNSLGTTKSVIENADLKTQQRFFSEIASLYSNKSLGTYEDTKAEENYLAYYMDSYEKLWQQRGSVSLEAFEKALKAVAGESLNTAENVYELAAAMDEAKEQGVDETVLAESYGNNLLRLAENYDLCAEAVNEYKRAQLIGNNELIKQKEEELEATLKLAQANEKLKYSDAFDINRSYDRSMEASERDIEKTNQQTEDQIGANRIKAYENLNGKLIAQEAMIEDQLNRAKDRQEQAKKSLSDLLTDQVAPGIENGQITDYEKYMSYLVDQRNKYSSMLEDTDSDNDAMATTRIAQYDQQIEKVNEYVETLDEADDYVIQLNKDLEDNNRKQLEKTIEKFEKAQDDFDSYVDTLESYKDFMQLIGDNNALTESLNAINDINKQAFDTAKIAYEQIKTTVGSTPEQVAAAQKEMLNSMRAWTESLKEVVLNELEGFDKEFANAMLGDMTFDEMAQNLQYAQSLQEEYLTDTNKIYETNKLINEAQKQIDATTNDVAKQKLKNFINQTKELEKQNKLSKFELDIRKAEYDVMLAEIALQEAQQAKSAVRLRRDSEGNFGYVYTADAGQVADAEQRLADAQNALYNVGLDGANKYAQKQVQITQEAQDAISQLTQQWINGEIESEEEYKRRVAETTDYYVAKYEEASNLLAKASAVDASIASESWGASFASQFKNLDDFEAKLNEYASKSAGAVDEYKTTLETTIGGEDSEFNSIFSKTIEDANALTSAINGGTDADGNTTTGAKDAVEKYGESAQWVVDNGGSALETNLENTATNVENLTAAIEGEDEKDLITALDNAQTKADAMNSVFADLESSLQQTATQVDVLNDAIKDLEDKTVVITYQEEFISSENNENNTLGSTKHLGMGGRTLDVAWQRFDTGGYTGQWGAAGKLAILDEKEIVLNQDDTVNLLASIELLRGIVDTLDVQTASQMMGGILTSPGYNNNYSNPIEQNVKIEASFPAVQDRNEIEEAFNNLINKASQYANRK